MGNKINKDKLKKWLNRHPYWTLVSGNKHEKWEYFNEKTNNYCLIPSINFHRDLISEDAIKDISKAMKLEKIILKKCINENNIKKDCLGA